VYYIIRYNIILRLTTGGIRCADHATHSIRKSWRYFANKRPSLGRHSSLANQIHGGFVSYWSDIVDKNMKPVRPRASLSVESRTCYMSGALGATNMFYLPSNKYSNPLREDAPNLRHCMFLLLLFRLPGTVSSRCAATCIYMAVT
jgi:hypothetical protein